MQERRRRPAHSLHYIDWALSAVDAQLMHFNGQLNEPKP